MFKHSLSGFLQVLPEAHALLSADGAFLGANCPFFRLLGQDTTFFAGKSISDFVAETRPVSDYLRLCLSNRSFALGAFIFQIERTLVPVRCEGARLDSEEGPVILLRLKGQRAATLQFKVLNEKIAELTKEILERRVTELKLRQQTEWFQVTLSSIGDAVIAADKNAHITFLNPVAAQMTGWEMQDAIGKSLETVFNIVNEKTQERASNPVEHVLREGIVVGLANHTALISKNQTVIAIEDSAAPIRDSEGEIVGAVMVFHDVTEKRLVEEKLSRYADDLKTKVQERTAHLTHSIQTLEGVCYTMAHDLRGPLRSIQGAAQILAEDNGAVLNEAGKKLTHRITNSAVRMDAMIHDLLAYAKLNHMSLPSEEIDLKTSVGKVITDMATELDARNANIRVREPLALVHANKILLDQILANVLGNSVKFVAKGVSPQVEVWAERAGELTHLFIKDNGIGIAPEHHERVFEIFHRLHANEKEYQGTGVGLAIVKKGMERMGGRVDIEPVVTSGTCFRLQFRSGDWSS